MPGTIKIVECPRDAMQGWHEVIATDRKVAYLNQLLKVGFDTLDCVSFVNPKAIPQMADSAAVIDRLNLAGSQTRLLAIVANYRGAQAAAAFGQIGYLGFPFSISETFQQLNTNSSIEESWKRLCEIRELCAQHNKQLVVYLSMGFGNPYGDPYNETVIGTWVEKMRQEGIGIISLADTVGLATPEMVARITRTTVDAFPGLEIGVHLHSTGEGFEAKMEAALGAGCRRFDGALKGIGGCPMANNPLVGNMDTLRMVDYFDRKGIPAGINKTELAVAGAMAMQIFE